MKTVLKLIGLVIVLNLVRYFVGGPIEGFTIMEPMHRVMPMYPNTFDNDFTSADFAISLVYNYLMWFWAAVVFHLIHPQLKGPFWWKSLQGYWLMGLFFCSLAAVYMNHYVDAIKPFFIWSMVDAAIVFTVVGFANALFYPLFFRKKK
ncbi:MAG: hypothetical protein DWQ47_01060 [Acidobacteria bacterium]|nr:MAG: hypothetical protein DWQ32_11520 [Acidobacteriota bacterium]REK04091.1 MAG: hypothetical protein DWQ38_01045 [Acidobacteriota bacterium]REK15253.1 MAG: hypothetical protein DWQ43_17210 [Acidobacteriota bacterium]REK46343.1 MAG: hypothetical protein DWQ47_01060 [Acidobacteriota bacterium]